MLSATALRWSWSNVLTAKRTALLVEKFGDLDKARSAVSLELLRGLGCREDTALAAMNRLEEFDPEAYEAELKRREITFLSIEDEGYPKSLKTIADPPTFLYARGDISILNSPCLALVGSREMSDYGKRVTEQLVPPIVRAHVVTVSGLAYGVDSEVAKQTIAAGGKTVAVLGHGLGQIYPKAHERLAHKIVESGGLLLSEFPLDTEPDKFTFPARNRIIAGLSLGTVVVEAAIESGSLITAELALEYGRDVFAVPGSIFDANFAGCHTLLSRGHAKLVTSAEEILSEIGVVSQAAATNQTLFKPESDEEKALYDVLTSLPASMDELVEKTGLDASVAGATLTILELKGAARNVGGGKWIRA